MKKIYTKLIGIVMALLLSVSVVVASTYAWMVMSSAPEMKGVQVTIGGGNTILVAADLTKVKNGVTYHYPDSFQSLVNFTQHDSYRYLSDLAGLTPVSTADGVNWFIPAYYDLLDVEVQEGSVLSGTLKPIDRFHLDKRLVHANLTNDDTELISEGSYIYLDFWVVSPGQDYTLRISTGNDSNGSFVINLPRAAENGNSLILSDNGNDASECVRIGFFANQDTLSDENIEAYRNSKNYAEQYTLLRGFYMEPEGISISSPENRFTIYEPNGDSHMRVNGVEDGKYAITMPIGISNGAVGLMDIRDRLTVQKKSTWTEAETGIGTQLKQRFQTALFEMSNDVSVEEAETTFYEDYLAGQVAPYVTKGQFIRYTAALYTAAINGVADLSSVLVDNATSEVYIVKLERNIPQRIRMFIWIEGQDVDCVNSAEASLMALSIELAGSNVEDE